MKEDRKLIVLILKKYFIQYKKQIVIALILMLLFAMGQLTLTISGYSLLLYRRHFILIITKPSLPGIYLTLSETRAWTRIITGIVIIATKLHMMNISGKLP